jgi:WhiB family redox-sensing transcriptional regulator
MRFSGTPSCLGLDTELFFPDEGMHYQQLGHVKRICKNCPVQDECFKYAIENKVQGIWAGTTTDQRDEYRRKHRIIGKEVLPEILSY